jgi:hypothetical protein
MVQLICWQCEWNKRWNEILTTNSVAEFRYIFVFVLKCDTINRWHKSYCLSFVSFRSPYPFNLPTAGVEVVYFHLITLRHTPQSVGLLWTRDRPVAETSAWQHRHSQETNIHAPGEIRTHDLSKRSAADLRLRPRGHWDRQEPVKNIYGRVEIVYRPAHSKLRR